jgi:thiopurine S-methyltransferase
LQPEFWRERWRTGQIGFHQSAVDSRLTRHWADLALAGSSRVFVPLCGKSLDLEWLRERGYFVAGVELSAVALESFCVERGIPAKRRTQGRRICGCSAAIFLRSPRNCSATLPRSTTAPH